ncbi:cytochrome P450 1A1-like [Lineus longissimus]|uniref:cytochrome P450 1A1-like n=1 Tax=Lineus longissimus TaxID=88925 RepID=UPI00315D6BEA
MGVLSLLTIPELSVAIPVFLIAVVMVFVIQALMDRSQSFPGPFRLPLVGNIPQLGKRTHESLKRLSDTYGDVMTIWLGGHKAIVLSSIDAMKDCFLGQAVTFSGRPHFDSFDHALESGVTPIAVKTLCPGQRFQRKTLREGIVKFVNDRDCPISPMIESEAEELITRLMEKTRDGLDPVNPADEFYMTATAVIYRLAYGEFDRSNIGDFATHLEYTRNLVKWVGTSKIGDLFPWTQPFFRGQLTEFLKARDTYKAIVHKKINRHFEEFDENNIRDIMDDIIRVMHNTTPDQMDALEHKDPDMIWMSLALVAAGTETTGSSLNWVLVYLLKHSEHLKKVHAEIDDVIGRDRNPTADDRKKLPYLDACILEALRLCPPIPLAIPHAATTDVEYRGKKIPKGCIVFSNIYAIHRNPQTWKNPDVYDPTRFLNADGEVIIAKQEMVVPFGLGMRRCLGETLARAELFVIIATLLQKFDVTVAPGSEVNLVGDVGLTVWPKPYQVMLSRRQSE